MAVSAHLGKSYRVLASPAHTTGSKITLPIIDVPHVSDTHPKSVTFDSSEFTQDRFLQVCQFITVVWVYLRPELDKTVEELRQMLKKTSEYEPMRFFKSSDLDPGILQEISYPNGANPGTLLYPTRVALDLGVDRDILKRSSNTLDVIVILSQNRIRGLGENVLSTPAVEITASPDFLQGHIPLYRGSMPGIETGYPNRKVPELSETTVPSLDNPPNRREDTVHDALIKVIEAHRASGSKEVPELMWELSKVATRYKS